MGESPFANIPPGKENDFQFLLLKVYDALVAKIDNLGTLHKGKLGEHESRINKIEGSTTALEVCPCNKRHDPGTPCPLYLLENEVLRNKWRNAGIKIGLFLAGGIVYHLAQLAMSWMKLPVSP